MTIKCPKCDTGVLEKEGDPKAVSVKGEMAIDQLYRCNKCRKPFGHRSHARQLRILGNDNPEKIEVKIS